MRQGRKLSDADPTSYFIDDENSVDLFMGYAVAALRLRAQLSAHGVSVDAEHPLFVYLPCGVGGAPGGITFGLKKLFGDAVHCFFVEPVNAPCMLAAFAKGECVPVAEFGSSGKTQADGKCRKKGDDCKFELKKIRKLICFNRFFFCTFSKNNSKMKELIEKRC